MFKPISDDTYFSKNDSNDIRFGDIAKNLKVSEADFLLYAYPDDRGVKNNGGRIGAKEGPKALRELFYKMTPSATSDTIPKISDLGDLELSDSIGNDHNSAISSLESFSKPKKMAIGGGHDYSYPDGIDFLNQKHDHKPVIINFDAHLDCRPLGDEINSGTPFYRLLNERSQDFYFYEIGLQEQCNSKKHHEWAKEKGMKSLWLSDIYNSTQDPISLISSFLNQALFKKAKAYVSIDLDAFSSAFAPGCSQSWPTGLNPESVFPILELIYKRLDVTHLGIYELCPRLDYDQKTARLAAKLMHHYICSHI